MPTIVYTERRALAWDDVLRLAAEAGTFGPLVLLLAATGLRIGEACGLRWRNVVMGADYDFLAVEANFTRSEMTTPKNGKVRIVPLTPVAVATLNSIPRRGPDDLVFFNRAGSPLDSPNVLNRYVKPAAKRIALGKVDFHTLRHTANTMAEQAGIGVAAQQKFMGHADARTNARYTHPEAKTFIEAMARVQTLSGKRGSIQ